MFQPRMDMTALARSAVPVPLQRYKMREFVADEEMGWGLLVVHTVDVLDPNAAIPVGTVITCPAGHEIATMIESVQRRQIFSSSAIGPFRPFQGLGPFADTPALPWRPSERRRRIGPCLCGREWTRGGASSGSCQIHTRDGWLPAPEATIQLGSAATLVKSNGKAA